MIDISSQTTINTIVKTHKFYNDEGIFYLSDEKAVCSYPEEGNNQCFQIEDDSFWFKHRNKIIETVVNNYSQKNSVFFDVGGGAMDMSRLCLTKMATPVFCLNQDMMEY